MTRTEFEQFRDLPEKQINANIAFSEKKNHPSILTTGKLPIVNSLGIQADLEIHYNPDEDSKVFVILLSGNGPICRLCVDNGPLGECPSSHKHGLLTPGCPKENLRRDVQNRSQLDGLSLREAFDQFCVIVSITHNGTFTSP